MRRFLGFAVVVAVLAILTLATSAQETEPPSFGFRQWVRATFLSVQVVNKTTGRSVPGLEKPDFRIFIGDQPVPIDTFERYGDRQEGLTGGDAIPQSAAAAAGRGDRNVATAETLNAMAGEGTPGGRLFMFLFDGFNSNFQQLGRTRELVTDFVKTEPRAGDRVGVVYIDPVGRLQLTQPFTRDFSKAVEALEKLSFVPGNPTRVDSERDLYKTFRDLLIAGCSGAGAAGVVENAVDMMFAEARQYSRLEFQRALGTLEQLKYTVASLSAFQGRKVLAMISNGISVGSGANYGRVMQDLLDPIQWSEQDIINCLQLLSPESGLEGIGSLRFAEFTQRDSDLATILNDLLALSQNGDIAIYTLNPSGLELGGLFGMQSGRLPIRPATLQGNYDDYQEIAKQLAADTGGRFLGRTNDLQTFFDDIAARTNHYYVLGFLVPNLPYDGKSYKIRVEVDELGDEYQVIHTRNYIALDPSVMDSAKISAALQMPEMQNEIPLQVSFHPILTEKDKYVVPVEVMIPLHRLFFLRDGQKAINHCEIIGAVLDSKGQVVSWFNKGLDMRADPSLAEIWKGQTSRFLYRDGLTLPAGDYDFRVVLQESTTTLLGTNQVSLKLPKTPNKGILLPQPMLGSRLEKTVVANAVAFDLIQFLPVVGGERLFFPSPGNRFLSNSDIYVFLQIADGSRKRPVIGDYSCTLTLTDVEGRPIGQELPIESLAYDQKNVLSIWAQLPPALPVSGYRLLFRVEDPKKKKTAETGIGFEIIESAEQTLPSGASGTG